MGSDNAQNLPELVNGYDGKPHEALDTPRRCTAKSKTSGQQCKNPAIAPTDKCRFHGGYSPRGVAHPSFKHGQHSRYLPKHLKRDYRLAIKDPELLSLRSQVALLASREMELTRDLAATEGPPWEQVVGALVDVENVMAAGDQDQSKVALSELAKIVREGADQGGRYATVWAELRQVILERTKVAQAEHKRMELVGGYVAVQDLMAVLMGLLEAVRQHVTDMRARQAIQNRFNELIGE
jgi:hypothetical protein